jgi:hypothetical protein
MNHEAAYRRILNRMGYYNYQRGLIYHHMNEEGSWNYHLKSCRNFILKSVEYYKPSVVTVLGSGWLLDLPLMEISQKLSLINLVDIVHPPEVRSQTADLKNIILIEEDITGGLIEEVWNKTRHRSFLNRLRNLDSINIPAYNPVYETGMIISLNIITQLESLLVEWLKKKSTADNGSLIIFGKTIQENHLSFLKKHNSIIISDVSEVITDRTGNVSEKQSLLVQLPEGRFREDWTWDFELKTSDYYSKKSSFKVVAIIF